MIQAFKLLRDTSKLTVTPDELLSTREQMLSVSQDGYTRYVTGWLAIESARIVGSDSTEEVEIAKNDWRSVIEDSVTYYKDFSKVLPYMARTCLQLAHVIHEPEKTLDEEQRKFITRRLGDITRADDMYMKKSCDSRSLGYLTELATLQLIWRNDYGKELVAIPTNPAQDNGLNSSTNADLHAYGSRIDMPFTPIPVQVKLRKQGQYTKYNNRLLMLIGADDNFFSTETRSLDDKVYWVTEACAREAFDKPTDEDTKKALDVSSVIISSKIRKLSRNRYRKQIIYGQSQETPGVKDNKYKV